MEHGEAGVKGSWRTLFFAQGLYSCLPPSYLKSQADCIGDTLTARHKLPPPIQMYLGPVPPWRMPRHGGASQHQAMLWSWASPRKPPWQSKPGFSRMSSTAGSTCYKGCRRGHLLKAAQTTKITHRHLRGFKSLPLLKDQMLVVDSYNKNHASCKPSAGSPSLVDFSGFKECFSKPFFNFSVHKIL